MKVSKTLSLVGTPTITVGQVRTLLNSVGSHHDDVVLSISSERFNHPTDPGYDRISVTYDEEV